MTDQWQVQKWYNGPSIANSRSTISKVIWKLHKLWQECLTAINAVLKVTANNTAYSPIHPVTQIITWSCCIWLVAVLLVGHHMGQTTIWELPRHHLLLESLHKMLWTRAMWVSDFVWWRLERRADLVWDFDKLKLGGYSRTLWKHQVLD